MKSDGPRRCIRYSAFICSIWPHPLTLTHPADRPPLPFHLCLYGIICIWHWLCFFFIYIFFFIEVILSSRGGVAAVTTINSVYSWTRMTFFLSLIKPLQVESILREQSFLSCSQPSVHLWLSAEWMSDCWVCAESSGLEEEYQYKRVFLPTGGVSESHTRNCTQCRYAVYEWINEWRGISGISTVVPCRWALKLSNTLIKCNFHVFVSYFDLG